MVQFVANGPDIPDALLQAHEEGRVVFFCGAGISYPAGLPGFKGLVENIYQKLGTVFNDTEKEAFDKEQFDTTLDLLERRLPGGRLKVRRALAETLQPKLRRKGATDTHAALLALARNRKGELRLVTTNFDHLFNVAAKRTKHPFHSFSAPMLPVPKDSRWNGLVYLHGLLPDKTDDTALDRLVVSSGDFGLAYLAERWAARFVSELFRNYVVCFVGYSINDPVMRYMMDALAADRMRGENSPQAWALGDYDPDNKEHKTQEWDAKGVQPILYQAIDKKHATLHQTLQAWAAMYRDGVQGKEAIVTRYALTRPEAHTQQDDFVGRMLWALSDKSGLPAKRFADFDPAPSLDWLKVFSERWFRCDELIRFGIHVRPEENTNHRFNMLARPSDEKPTPLMRLAYDGSAHGQWDEVMYHLARWLTRHLDDPELLLEVIKQGGQLHPRFQFLIEDKLQSITLLEREGKNLELDKIRKNAPNAIPRPGMRILWGLLISGLVNSPRSNWNLYSWKRNLNSTGRMTTGLRAEIRRLLSPTVKLTRHIPFSIDVSKIHQESATPNQLVHCEIALQDDTIRIQDDRYDYNHKCFLKYISSWLPGLLIDIQQLLHDTLMLQEDLGQASKHHDLSYIDVPSISPHEQNQRDNGSAALIKLLREAWMRVFDTNKTRAKRVAQDWFDIPYPIFKRLALFAASQDGCIPVSQWTHWLLNDDARWLWATETRREVCRLLVLQGRNLDESHREALVSTILSGPPPKKSENKTNDNTAKTSIAEYEIYLRLRKIRDSGLELTSHAKEKLKEIAHVNPKWSTPTDERDEFSVWKSGTGYSDYERLFITDRAPRTRNELAAWLKKPVSEHQFFVRDTWEQTCRTHLLKSLYALCDLSKEDVWPIERWKTALQVWSQPQSIRRSWKHAHPLIASMPCKIMKKIANSLALWINSASKNIETDDEIQKIIEICEHILDLPIDGRTRATDNNPPLERPIEEAINHPVGYITEALISLLSQKKPKDNDGLKTLKPIFTKLCNIEVDRFRHARALMGRQLIFLFRIDRIWTEQHLLPLFNWSTPSEAKGVWQGFLLSPRLYQPLMMTLKTAFLETAKNYADLGEYKQQYAALLTYAALDKVDGYTINDFRNAFSSLPVEGLKASADSLAEALQGASEQHDNFWENRVKPFWHEVWPKSRDLATPDISESLADLAISANNNFSDAFAEVKDWLTPLRYPDHVVHSLHESGLPSRYPRESLMLLDKINADQPYAASDLKNCLDQIGKANPNLKNENAYKRLQDYARSRQI